MTTISVQRSVAGVLTSADSAVVSIYNSSGAAVVSLVPVVPASAGVYSYEITTLTPGTYTAVWVFSVSGMSDDTVTRVFNAEGPVQIVPGITLAEIERRVARRVGRFRYFKANPTGDSDTLTATRLRSSLDLGDLEDLYILRRGVLADGSQIADFSEDDRVRIVSEYDPSTASITPDSSWAMPPQDTEMIELHSLDPEQDLRPSIVMGLERCFFWDKGIIDVTGALRELPVTASLPWITDPGLINQIETNMGSSLLPPTRTMWWRPFISAGGVKLHTDWLAPGSLEITALRAHSTYVNGEYAPAGPNDDFDVLYIDPEYAARAGHVSLWINCTDQMTPLAAQGLRLTSEQAADAFTSFSKLIAEQAVDFLRLRWETDSVLVQVGNAPEAP